MNDSLEKDQVNHQEDAAGSFKAIADRISPHPIKDYAKFISHTSSNRRYSFLRVFVKCLETLSADAVFLAGGLPSSSSFPINDVSVKLRDGSQLDLGPELTAVAMQYGVTDGYKPLLDVLRELLKRYHAMDDERLAKSKLIVTPGAQDGLCKTIEAILDEGDYVILEDAMYPGTLAALAAVKPSYLLVEGDGDGMKPESLRRVLAPWTKTLTNGDDGSHGAGHMTTTSGIKEINKQAIDSDEACHHKTSPPPPKLLIICPSGGNPTGSCLALERKVEIYQIAQEHNLMILEDDPYFFLQFQPQERIPSFLSMDVDGRVVRADSFSKIVSAGMRLGFLVGPEPIVDRVLMHEQVTMMCPPGITQVILYKLLESWGWDRFEAHVNQTRDFYREQKDAMVECCRKYLSDLAEWAEPRGGMFVWMKLKGVPDTLNMCLEHGFQEGIVVLPGSACSPYPDRSSPYIRISYSLVSPDIMEKGMKRLRHVILKQLEAQRQQQPSSA